MIKIEKRYVLGIMIFITSLLFLRNLTDSKVPIATQLIEQESLKDYQPKAADRASESLSSIEPQIEEIDDDTVEDVIAKNNIQGISNEYQWSNIVHPNSEQYEELLIQFENNEDRIVVIDDVAFSRRVNNDQILFMSIDEGFVDAVLRDNAWEVYNKYLDILTLSEELGDWSANTERELRLTLGRVASNASISAVECRQKACVAELYGVNQVSYDDMYRAIFDKKLNCQCIISPIPLSDSDVVVIKYTKLDA